MKRDMRDLAGLYAVNALDAGERAEFEAFLEQSPDARAEVDEYLATAARLSAAEATRPPASMKTAVMEEVSNTRQEVPVVTHLATRTRRRMRVAIPAAVAAAVIAVLGIATWRLSATVDSLQQREDILAAPDALTIELVGDVGEARIVWSRGVGRLVVVGDALPDPGDGMTYELWGIDDGEATPIGLFDSDGDATVEVLTTDAVITEATVLAVTVEVDGGVDQPTGSPVLVSASQQGT